MSAFPLLAPPPLAQRPRSLASALLLGGVVSLVTAVTACSSTETKPAAPGAGGPVSALAISYADGFCAYLNRCSPFSVKGSYGDVARCRSVIAAAADVTLRLDGSSIGQGQIDACAGALRGASCEVLADALPECQFKGTLADGAPCSSGAQCVSASCFLPRSVITENPNCGTCVTPVGEGADCTNTECTAGLVCDANRCFKPGAEGAACTDEQPCGVALECVQGKCTKLLAPGAACEKESSLCDVFGGYTCVRDGEGTTGTCQPIEFAPVGQPCGVDLTTGKVTSCAASSCSDLAENGSCVAPLVEGAACSELEGPGCEVGLECRDGSCQRPDLACD